MALSVNYGPSMPFTATRSGTTATATLTYSYPLVVGDNITVTGASNAEWNSTYTIASIVSGTQVTFTVPATHSATAGTGAVMQTTGTAVLDPAAVASAVWGAANRTITGGTVDTLTNAPTVPSAAAIASQVRTELGTELGRLDTSVSSRLASSGYTAPTTPPTVIQIRAEMDSNSTKLANLDATVSSRLAPSGTLARVTLTDTVTTLTNAPSVPTPAQIAAEVWAKPTTELTVTGSIGERAKNQSTVSTTGAQIAAALS
ncbi:MAG: hypothetical protein EBY29_07705 [Planctomycetes bacterium]|nr:hypothetical protein [Planctomycetota bacterium]